MSKTKQKSLEELLEEALVPEEEQPYEVPGNWVWVRLKSINKDKKEISILRIIVRKFLNYIVYQVMT